MKTIQIQFLNSITGDNHNLLRRVKAVTPELIIDILKAHLQSQDADDVEPSCSWDVEVFKEIYEGEWYFIVHSEDLVVSKDIGFIKEIKLQAISPHLI